MSRWLTFFLLINCYCVTCFNTGSPCRNFQGDTSHVCDVMGENISVTCNVPSNCTRGYWSYANTTNIKWLLPGYGSGDTYLSTFNSSQGVNTLHIYNIDDSVIGVYSCLCDDHYGNRTTHACFNLSVPRQCPISVRMSGEAHVFDKCGVRNAVKMVDVKVNENITIQCDKNGKRRTNCSHIGMSFTVEPSHHWCEFSCKPKNQRGTCDVISIILNVMNNSISTTAISTGTTPETTRQVLDTCGVRNEVEMVDVEVNENITIKCDGEAERRTNCSHIGKRISFTVNPSHHLCCFSCRPKNDGVKRIVHWVILNIMNKAILTSTTTLYTEIFSPSKTHFIGDVTSNVMPDQRWMINNLLHIIIASSLILVFAIVGLSTCACGLFYKTRVCKSSLQYTTRSAGDVYHDIVEMQSPDTNSFYTRHIDHRIDLEDNDVILSDIDDITNDSVGFQFYDEPDAYFTVNKVGPKVPMDGTVGKTGYNLVQKSPVEMRCTMSYSPNTGGDMDTYTGVADVETHGRDDMESNMYTFVDRNELSGTD